MMNIYSIKMKKSLFFKYSEKIVASSVKVLDNFVYFKTDGITKKYLDENKINYTLSENEITKIKKKNPPKSYFNFIMLNICFSFIH